MPPMPPVAAPQGNWGPAPSSVAPASWGPPPAAAPPTHPVAARDPLLDAAQECEGGGWGPPSDDEAAEPDAGVAAPSGPLTAEERAQRRKGIAIAVCTMMLSVPALIGSWCWPIFLGVVVGLLSGQSFQSSSKNAASHEHTISFFHGLQVAIMMTVMLNIVQYAYWTVLSKRKRVQGHWAKFGPVYILVVASALVNTQPMMILTIGSWRPAQSQCITPEFHDTWPCTNAFWTPEATNSFFPNRWQGWTIQICCTWLGFVLLVVGVVQATELHKKMRRTWQQARGRQP